MDKTNAKMMTIIGLILITLTGSLTIEGATTIIDSTNLVVTDKTVLCTF